VFVLLGLSATTLGRAAFTNRAALTRISGLIVLAMALFGVGSLVLQAPWLFKENRFHPGVSGFGASPPRSPAPPSVRLDPLHSSACSPLSWPSRPPRDGPHEGAG
jgi:cytochrome c biogenesis protein CcdA